MPDRKPQTFDHEPVTRRGGRAPEAAEGDEEFSFLRRQPTPSTATAAEWLKPPSNFPQPIVQDAPPFAAAPALPAGLKTRVVKRGGWILRRGHFFSFIGLLLFTAFVYIRPHELYPTVAALKGLTQWIAIATLLVFLPSQLAAEGTLTARPREVNLLLLLSVAVLMSIPLALDRTEAWAASKDYLKVVIMFIVMVNVMRTEWRLKILLLFALVVSCAVSVGAINDYHNGNFATAADRIKGIIGGMFDNPNDMALHLVMMTPIAVALWFGTRNMFSKVCYAACAALLIAGNIVTFSRGGLLGLIGAMGVLLWKLGRRHRVPVFVVALSLTFSLLIFMPGTMVERIASVLNPASDVSAGDSAIGRQALLVRSLVVMAYNPLLGVGMGNFHTVSIREQVSHNAYTQIGAEVGIPAMVLYIMFIWAAYKRVHGVERETLTADSHSRFYYLAVGLQASLVGYMISSFFLSVAHLHYLYYLVGYAICLHRIYEARPALNLSGAPEHSSAHDAGRERTLARAPA